MLGRYGYCSDNLKNSQRKIVINMLKICFDNDLRFK
jgi:hypothetical protein